MPFEEGKLVLRILIKNARDGVEIGESKLELDELIDTNLKDLAKEYCVCLNRSYILNTILSQQIKEEGEESKENLTEKMKNFSQYSGIIRF